MKPYPLIDDLVGPVLRVGMPRAPRVLAPGGTRHVGARCKHRECSFTTADDFAVLRAHLRELVRTDEVPVDAYTLRATPVHPALAGPSRTRRWGVPSAGS